MPVTIECYGAPPPQETLPALKLTHWYGAPARDEVYAYARLCVCAGGLQAGLTVFDGAPPPTQCAVVLLALPKALLRLELTAQGEVRLLADGKPLAPPPAAYGRGADEQGWYWQAVCTLPPQLLARFGCPALVPGATLRAGILLQDTLEAAFGSVFAAPDVPPTPTAALDTLVLVPAAL